MPYNFQEIDQVGRFGMKWLIARVALIAAGLLLAAEVSLAQDLEVGVIRNCSGTVNVVRNGDTVAAVVGESIRDDDVIETGADGTIGIVLADASQISLGPQSEFHLEDFAFEPLQQQYSILGRVLQGTLVYISGDIGRLSPENVRIEVPWGVIGLRGTRLAVSVEGS
ncbi:MAG: FecR domain-containing protein [Rhodospirillaceae bacterium]|nr:FecR domain-containing protein [Rhodospirillaceae bacterium]